MYTRVYAIAGAHAARMLDGPEIEHSKCSGRSGQNEVLMGIEELGLTRLLLDDVMCLKNFQMVGLPGFVWFTLFPAFALSLPQSNNKPVCNTTHNFIHSQDIPLFSWGNVVESFYCPVAEASCVGWQGRPARRWVPAVQLVRR